MTEEEDREERSMSGRREGGKRCEAHDRKACRVPRNVPRNLIVPNRTHRLVSDWQLYCLILTSSMVNYSVQLVSTQKLVNNTLHFAVLSSVAIIVINCVETVSPRLSA